MRITIVLLLLITVLNIIPLKVLADNSVIDDEDDDDDDDDDDDEGQDDIPHDIDEDEEETDEKHAADTEATPEDEEKDLWDEDWLKVAVRDIAFYLRSHKFNDFDRRSYSNDSAPRVSNSTKSVTNAAAQAVSGRIPTSAARVLSRLHSCGICSGYRGTGAGFPLVFRSLVTHAFD
jgi:hypothetical protein